METPDTPPPPPLASPVPPMTPATVAAPVVTTENFPLGLLAGFGAALVGAAIWAGFTVATDMKIGWIAVGIGFLVGYAVRTVGKGTTQRFAIAGGVLSLLGCALGNYFTVLGVIASKQHLGFFELLWMIKPGMAVELMGDTFQFMDLVFYAIAVYEGFKFGRVKPAA